MKYIPKLLQTFLICLFLMLSAHRSLCDYDVLTTHKNAKLYNKPIYYTPTLKKRQFYIAGAGSYVLGNNYWTSNELGIKRGVGIRVGYNYGVNSTLSLVIETGFDNFQVDHNYFLSSNLNDILYTGKYKVSLIPIQIGVDKHFKSRYVGMRIGANYISTKFDSYSNYNLQSTKLSPSASIVLGISPRLFANTCFDVRFQYDINSFLENKSSETLPALQTINLLLGIKF